LRSSGFVLLHKPAGVTSFQALFPLKKIFKTKRIGHAGTLDLRASGLIIAGVERATRLLPYIESADKVYTFRLHLGFLTDTLEWDGELIEQGKPISIGEADLESILPSFRGLIQQVPPNYSAIKIKGVRASDLSLQGKEFELKSRSVSIYDLKIIGKCEPPENASGEIFASFELECHCSKGTYIRSLCRDIGDALGTFGCVSHICRTQIGSITLSEAVLPENLLESSIISPERILPYPVLTLSKEQAGMIRNGNWVPWKTPVENLSEENHVFVKNDMGEIVSLCRFEPGRVIPKFFIGQEE
jgi:tRNA pseudouridine55 synthase